MGARALVQGKVTMIQRIKPDAQGCREVIPFVGNIRQKPKGWRVYDPDKKRKAGS